MIRVASKSACCLNDSYCTSTRFKYYTGLKVRAKKHFYGRCAAVMSFSEAFFALLPPLHALLRGDRRAHQNVRATSVFTGLQLGCLMNLLIWGTSAFLRAAPGELAWRRLPLQRTRRVQRCVRRCRRTSESFSIRRTFTGRAAAGRVLVVY